MQVFKYGALFAAAVVVAGYMRWWNIYNLLVLAAALMIVGGISLFLDFRPRRRGSGRVRRRKPNPFGAVFGGFGLAVVSFLVAAVLLGGLNYSPIPSFFLDREREAFDLNIAAKTNTAVPDWAQIESLALEQLDKPISQSWRGELEKLVYDAIIGQARQTSERGEAEEAVAEYDRAIVWAQNHGIGPDLAVAEQINAQPTATPVPTVTPLPTLTPTPSPSVTPMPTATSTVVPSATPSPVPPTATNTPIPGTVTCIAQPVDNVVPPAGYGALIVLNRCGNDPTLFQIDWYSRSGEPPYNRAIRVDGVARFSTGAGTLTVTIGMDLASNTPFVVTDPPVQR